MKKNKTQSGMAIPMVLVFAAALGIVATYIIKNTMQYNRSNITSFAQLQAHFAARAGVEHAMLKIKFLHRELYDAICMAQGRNPLFDFTQITNLDSPESAIKTYNPGPIYLYRSGQFSPTRLFTPGFTMNAGAEKLWLKTFTDDIKSDSSTFGGVTTNAVLSMKPLPANIKNRMRDPFKLAEYGVTTLNIAAQEIAENVAGGAVSNTAIVEIVVESSVETSRGEVWDYEIRKTVRINRD
ncbi:MAG: hypothetical protein KKB51_04860 [Candidatus Riflebacteria bacterium]|nr:hypothetical protein [Candidatus Riflebacteria bacterium]